MDNHDADVCLESLWFNSDYLLKIIVAELLLHQVISWMKFFSSRISREYEILSDYRKEFILYSFLYRVKKIVTSNLVYMEIRIR